MPATATATATISQPPAAHASVDPPGSPAVDNPAEYRLVGDAPRASRRGGGASSRNGPASARHPHGRHAGGHHEGPKLALMIPPEVSAVLAKARESGAVLRAPKRLLAVAWAAYLDGREPTDSEMGDEAGCSEVCAMEWADSYFWGGLWPFDRDGAADEPDEDDEATLAEIAKRLEKVEDDRMKRADARTAGLVEPEESPDGNILIDRRPKRWTFPERPGCGATRGARAVVGE